MSQQKKTPWAWVPSLYFAEGLPYVIVMTVSTVMYKRLGLSNTDVAFYTSWLYLPWVIKPFWSPFVDIIKSKRQWVLAMELLIGASLGGVAFLIPAPFFLQATLAFFWLMAFASATHDIAADGYYMLALNEREQSLFVGIRSIFYRLSTMFGQGVLIWLAGMLESVWLKELFPTKNIQYAWSLIFFFIAALFIALVLYHQRALPKAETDISRNASVDFNTLMREFFNTIISFLKKKGIVIAILFLLFFRFAEAQLVKIIQLFLLDNREVGGLGLSTDDVGIVYGVCGVGALMLGGILGGICISKGGLKKWIWWMLLSLNLPSLVYVYLAYFQPDNMILVAAAIAIEQLGYGFGFTAYMMFMMYISKGKYQTAHYSICTAFMALGMMLPGMFAGWMQEHLGYRHFFIWVMLCAIPCFIITAFLKISPDFGKKAEK